MLAKQESDDRLADLEQELARVVEQQVRCTTWGRLQALEVEVTDNRVVIVRGQAPSYYLKQRALRGVLDVIQSAVAMRIELNIQVVAPGVGRGGTPATTATPGEGLSEIKDKPCP